MAAAGGVGTAGDLQALLVDLRERLVAIGRAKKIGLVDMLLEFVLIGRGEMITTLRKHQERKAAAEQPPPIPQRPPSPKLLQPSPIAGPLEGTRIESFGRSGRRAEDHASSAGSTPKRSRSLRLRRHSPRGEASRGLRRFSPTNAVGGGGDGSSSDGGSDSDTARGSLNSQRASAPHVHSLRSSHNLSRGSSVSLLSDGNLPVARLSSKLSLRRRAQLQKQLNALTPLGELPLLSASARNDRVARAFEAHHYGVEFEALVVRQSSELDVDTMVKAEQEFCPYLAEEMARHVEQDGPVAFAFYDCARSKADRLYTQWKVTTDSSITSEDGRPIFGFEVVSPKLLGWGNVRTAAMVAHTMQEYGCATNNTTALHVHVSCQHLSDAEVTQVLRWYVYFEFVIDKFHSFPRRGDMSRYCRSMAYSITGLDPQAPQTDAESPALQAVQTLGMCDVSHTHGFERMLDVVNPRLGTKMNSGRNHKVNATLLKGTAQGDPTRRVEFRQHAGSCDPEEVSMWIRFCVLFVAAASKIDVAIPDVEASPGVLWDVLGDPLLEEYYVRRSAALPRAPSDFRGFPRASAAAPHVTQHINHTARLQLDAMIGALGLPMRQAQQRSPRPPAAVRRTSASGRRTQVTT
eukprot:TRINITY_DN3521_c0_g1_i1.p1 TRINITY_DN3521_c0_g1~~TRINITY_DN3521_c0_g1_i1.p1  ORF type:complete len:632 (+),score=169.74 TRINITY_DN3521_c0_g1_i1:74-1969(+)